MHAEGVPRTPKAFPARRRRFKRAEGTPPEGIPPDDSPVNFYPTIPALLLTMRYKGYRVYDRENGFDINLVGVRTHGRTPNRFDDYVTVFYRANGEWILNVLPATTDPGAFYLENPLNARGTAILCEGQYLNSHAIGRHQGRYKALVQREPVLVVRDGNRDLRLDLDAPNAESGLFGINVHRASERNRSINVDRWSAGCQVIADPRQFNLLLDLCEEGRALWGNRFTYTLLHERDFEAATAAERLVPRGLDVQPPPIPMPVPRPIS